MDNLDAINFGQRRVVFAYFCIRAQIEDFGDAELLDLAFP